MNGNMELYNPNNELKKKNAKKLQRTKTKKNTANQYSRYFVIFFLLFIMFYFSPSVCLRMRGNNTTHKS